VRLSFIPGVWLPLKSILKTVAVNVSTGTAVSIVNVANPEETGLGPPVKSGVVAGGRGPAVNSFSWPAAGPMDVAPAPKRGAVGCSSNGVRVAVKLISAAFALVDAQNAASARK
jgi:hypothetical protein